MLARHRLLLLLLLLSSLLISNPILAQEKYSIEWSVIARLPDAADSIKNPGVAGAFSGIHNNVLLIAGGANFPEGMPWNGGKKVYHDDIYILEKKNNNDYDWIKTGCFKLPDRFAYGATVTTPEGVLCIGGENEKGLSKRVFLLQWNATEKNIDIKQLPDLPVPLTNSSAVLTEHFVYLAGGETTTGVSDKFYTLDLKNASSGWKLLPPLPKPMSHAVAVIQSNASNKCVYIIGGRQKKANGISDIFDSVFEFDILNNEWTTQKSLPYALSAGTGIAYGEKQILMFGGDKGETFHKTEVLIAAIAVEKNTSKRQKLVQKKNNLQQSHPGFCNEVLLFNTIKEEWLVIGKIPFPIPVTATAIKWGDGFFIPSGEIKAGVRTSNVLMGVINNKE